MLEALQPLLMLPPKIALMSFVWQTDQLAAYIKLRPSG